jgi:hypothetical protein
MAKSINVNISLSGLGSKIKNNLGLVFALLLLILFVLEALVLQNSVQLILNSHPKPSAVVKAKGVRINFVNYDAVTKHIDDGAVYQPPAEELYNPFTPYVPSTTPSS